MQDKLFRSFRWEGSGEIEVVEESYINGVAVTLVYDPEQLRPYRLQVDGHTEEAFYVHQDAEVGYTDALSELHAEAEFPMYR